MHGARGFGAASFYCVPVVYRARNASSSRCNMHARHEETGTGTTDCTVVPWTGTRMRYAGPSKAGRELDCYSTSRLAARDL